jgi:hypothetical protein
VESRHLQGCSPHLCRLRTDGLAHEQVLNVSIACRCYGPGKPSRWLSTKSCLFSTTSLAVVGEKLGTDPRIRRSSSYGLCWEPFFSGAGDLYKSIDDFVKSCYTLTA